MCKTKFKRGDMKGFALSEINAILGDSKDIESVLVPSNAEKEMLDELMDTVDLEYDAEDLIVDGWKSIVLDQKRDILFEEMYEEYVRSQKSEEKKGKKKPVDQVVQNEPEKLIELMEGLELLIKTMKEMNEKLDDHGIRMKNVELYLKEGRVRGSSLGFQPYQTTDSRIEKERAEMRRREEAEKLNKEKAEKEEKERAEKRMREQAEKEEKERAEKRKREQAEKQKKEKVEKEEKGRAEKRKREQAEKREREQAEKQKRDKAEKEEKERSEKRKREVVAEAEEKKKIEKKRKKDDGGKDKKERAEKREKGKQADEAVKQREETETKQREEAVKK